uniref:Uncharacterized protein n=1 Tax=Anguilla anguilla TaxID=7936 RepID=A0A0E9WXL7_ANGAN
MFSKRRYDDAVSFRTLTRPSYPGPSVGSAHRHPAHFGSFLTLLFTFTHLLYLRINNHSFIIFTANAISKKNFLN